MKILRALNFRAKRRAERAFYAELLELSGQVAMIHQELSTAVDHFADTFDDGMLASMVSTSFTCTEVDAIAGLLLAAGREEAGVSWLECHAEGDEYGDAHNQGTEVWDDQEDSWPTAVDIREYAHALVA
ncbi:hypothetical protein [Streptomyces sp. NPDC057617]|uniref:hypothetical protein n=1 Tax=Streptomyces sp. NPDC057617 TaxID=3346184 RepID=UPI0036BCA5AA